MDAFVGYEVDGNAGAMETTAAFTRSLSEPLHRSTGATFSQAHGRREERKKAGLVKFATDKRAPEGGAMSWRTRAGHQLKDQTYYTQLSKVNKWDLPRHAGTNTWKEWHGPRLKSDAETIERLDRHEEMSDYQDARKTYVNTTRLQTMDRFYNKKLERTQLEAAASWAPHLRARSEVHDSFSNFDEQFNELPQKRLKQVFTEKVLSNDRQAVRWIAQRIQQEDTFKDAWKDMEGYRREGCRNDLRNRQAQVDTLMHLSGQPVPEREVLTVSNASYRTRELCAARKERRSAEHGDVTKISDFRGLIHPDCEHALEALYPGFGQTLSKEFRARATESAVPGWPPPEKATTPRLESTGGPSPETTLQRQAAVAAASPPVSKPKMQKIGRRTNEDLLRKHSKAQFQATSPPPPPDQRRTLLEENWTPVRTMREKGHVNGRFERTDHLPSTGAMPSQRTAEPLPPPNRPYVYPMLAPTAPMARTSEAGQFTLSAPRKLKASSSAPMLELCRELDDFEAKLAGDAVARLSNNYGTPRGKV